jgi:N6-L-threonylcarbamoyladenine synthase
VCRIGNDEPQTVLKSENPVLLAIESSCDETAVAVLQGAGGLRSSLVASQAEIHAEFGGVVPEVASRNHLESLPALLAASLKESGLSPSEFDAFAATAGPGLGPALLVGLSCAKGLAIATGKPFLAINHLEGHLLSPFFGVEDIPPHIGLLVSGGHTMLVEVQGAGRYRVLGKTRDDAAGEAFDKAAKLLGLPYPGGALVDELAEQGDPTAIQFPRGLLQGDNMEFSFSGLKTALRYQLAAEPPPDEQRKRDICASFREAVVDVLVRKALAAMRVTGLERLAISGGVACNRRLRAALNKKASDCGFSLHLVESSLATDNAAMIAFAAYQRFRQGFFSSLDVDIQPAFTEFSTR